MLPKMRYRLGLDIGTTSIGWTMLRLNSDEQPVAVIKMGVRIFSDGRNPKDGSSLAVTRRNARQMRRRRDRLLRRKSRLLNALVELGFFPADEDARKALTSLDPYLIRKNGLDNQITPAEFGRAVFHINQRRGFKSNRRTDKSDKEGGALKKAIAKVREQLTLVGARTVGEWLADRHARKESVRARLRGKTVKDRAYDLYIDRAMVEQEFDALWEKQATFNATLFSEKNRTLLKDILLFQRPLKPVDPGRCTFFPEEDKRAALALPLIQRFRIYQEVNNLRPMDNQLQEAPLTITQRDLLVNLLERKGEVSFNTIRKELGLSGSVRFNLEDSKREKLIGNKTGVLLAKEDFFGERWSSFSEELQNEIVTQLISEQNESLLIKWLTEHTGCDERAAEKIANATLPEGYGNVGVRAATKILEQLKKDVITYNRAVELAGLGSHSALAHSEKTGEIFGELPYYGAALQRHVGFGSNNPKDTDEKRFGKIANPTVHIGLNELRKIINSLIKRYGHPSEIVVELAREMKQGKALRDEIAKAQAERQKQNEQYREKIRSLNGGVEPSTLDIQKMRLWEELNRNDAANRRCPYTGQQISMEMLYSEAVEIEHILPFARTLDDSLNNKTVALRRANRDKGNQTPFEAFGHSPEGYDFDAILERAKLMPKEKARRFAPDGMERWLKDDKDFLARALTDTAYLSRIAKEYLTLICPPNKVWVIPGRLTAMLRGKYGLNEILSASGEKNRNDHRHHAIDAAIVAITDRSLLKRFSDANKAACEKGLTKLVEKMPQPWPMFRDQLAFAAGKILVSHKPDHGYETALHNETAYGIQPDGIVRHRIPIDEIKSRDKIESADFGDERLKKMLLDVTTGLSGKEFSQKLEEFSKKTGIRRVRIYEKLSVIPMTNPRAQHRHGLNPDGSNRAYKGYKGDSNYCIEISRDANDKWIGDVISSFDANRIARETGLGALRHPTIARNGFPLIMRLMIDDFVVINDDKKTRIMRVAKISGNGQIFMSEHNEANVDARNREGSLKYLSKYAGSLKSAQARKVTISEIGEVRDRGFKE